MPLHRRRQLLGPAARRGLPWPARRPAPFLSLCTRRAHVMLGWGNGIWSAERRAFPGVSGRAGPGPPEPGLYVLEMACRACVVHMKLSSLTMRCETGQINSRFGHVHECTCLVQANPSAILVSERQEGNPVLKHMRNVRWQWADIVPDYQMGAACALFLSLRRAPPLLPLVDARLALLLCSSVASSLALCRTPPRSWPHRLAVGRRDVELVCSVASTAPL